MANIKLQKDSSLNSVSYEFSGILKAIAGSGEKKNYRTRAAIKSVEKLSKDGNSVTFKVCLQDGEYFTGTALSVIFLQLVYDHQMGPKPSDTIYVEQSREEEICAQIAKGLAYVFLAGVVFFSITAFWGSETTPKQTLNQTRFEAESRDANVMAATLCQQRVKDSLKAPRTAKFPFIKHASFDGRTAVLNSYVDAQNGFGAMIRTHYICTVEYSGGKAQEFENWRITDFILIE